MLGEDDRGTLAVENAGGNTEATAGGLFHVVACKLQCNKSLRHFFIDISSLKTILKSFP